MLINADVKSLEVVTAAYLSRDPVLMGELCNGVDLHGENQKRFGLPERRIAKIFVFRLLYGGTHYASDPDFAAVSDKPAFWDAIIDAFYRKYQGIAAWHKEILETVSLTGQISMPTGRVYHWPERFPLPETQIKNYPVQGLGADMVMLARIKLYRMLNSSGLLSSVKLISSVHDSILVDSPRAYITSVASMMKAAIELTPHLFEEYFGQAFDLPMTSEIQIGPSMSKMEDWNEQTG